MSTTTYQSWIADKVRRRGEELVKKLTRPVDAVSDALSAAGQGLDAFQRTVNDPLAGYLQRPLDTYRASRPEPVAQGPIGGAGSFESRVDPDTPPLPDWHESGRLFRDTEMSGAERFLTRTLADPTTYLGGYGKVAGAVPGLRKVAPAISAVEKVPAWVESMAATAAGKAVRTALPDVLTRPSVRSVAGKEADRVFDLSRRASGGGLGPDEAAELEGFRHVYPGLDKTLGDTITSVPQGPRHFSPGPRHFEPRTRWSFSPDTLPPRSPADLQPRQPGRTKLPADPGFQKAGAAAESVLDQKIADLRALIRQKRDAEIAGGSVREALGSLRPSMPTRRSSAPIFPPAGAGSRRPIRYSDDALFPTPSNAGRNPAGPVPAVAAPPAGTREAFRTAAISLKARTQDAADRLVGKPYREGFSVAGLHVNPSEINRAGAMVTLNTPAYIAGNAAEDAARSALGGVSPRRMGARDFARETAQVPDMPRELYFEAGSTARGLGSSQSTGNRILDLLTGRTVVNAADRTTAGYRRNFLTQKVQEGVQAGLPVEEASARAVAAFRKEFPNYTDESNLDVLAKAVMPFWNYEKQRPGYLARKAAEYPGLADTVRDYYGATEDGNIPVAGDFEVNPLRGTVLNQVAAIGRPDFPSYAQGPSGTIENVLEQAGRAGFYPGTVAQSVLAAQRAVSGEPIEAGRLVPTPALAPLLAAEGLGAVPVVGDLPVVEQAASGARRVHDLLGDRFHDYAVARELAAMGIEPERATPEQRTEAAERAGARLLAMTEAGTVRWRPEGPMREERLQEAIAAGVPEAVARAAAERGNPVSTVDEAGVPYLNAAQKRAIYDANPEWERWGQVTEPLRRPEEQLTARATREFFAATEQIDTNTRTALRTLYERWNAGAITGKELREQRGAIMTEARLRRQQLEESARQRGALVDAEAREAFAKATGRELAADTPEDQVARQYYAIEPQTDPLTGAIDWDGFFAQREAAIARLSPETRRYVLEEYPARRYASDPVVAQGEAWYQQAIAGVREYMDQPRYIGIEREREAEMEQAADLLSYLRTQHPDADTRTLRGMVARVYPNSAWLAQYAGRLRNPARERFLAEHPDVALLLGEVTGQEVAGMAF
ncbi:MAG: hypothetical protein AB7R89_19045 [Dehalococcoidia bacterium]